MREKHLFLIIQNKLHWHTYRLLRGHTVSEKLPKIPLFEPPLIHQLWLLGSQQHPQSGVLLTSFSAWGTESSLVEIILESTGSDRGFNGFLGQKLVNTYSFVGRCIIVQQEKISRAERYQMNPLNALLEAINYSFTKFCIYCFFPLVQILCALCLESQKKLSTWSWCRTFRISLSSTERCLTNPFRTLWLCS